MVLLPLLLIPPLLDESRVSASQLDTLKERLLDLGHISVSLWRVENFRIVTTAPSRLAYRGQLSQVDVIPEKAMKGQALDTSAQSVD